MFGGILRSRKNRKAYKKSLWRYLTRYLLGQHYESVQKIVTLPISGCSFLWPLTKVRKEEKEVIMPYYFDLKKQEVIFSRYEYTPQYLDGEWTDLPPDNTCYAIKNGQAIFEGTPEGAFNQSYDKVILKNQGSLPVYTPDTVVNIINDTPSNQTVEQQDLLEYLQAELASLKSGQQTTVTTYENHDQLISSLSNQIEVLTAALANAPSQKTVEQQAAIDFLTAELAKLKETGVSVTPAVVEVGADNQEALINSLNNNFEALSALIVSGVNSTPSTTPVGWATELSSIQEQVNKLEATTATTSTGDFSEQNVIIQELSDKIDNIEITSSAGPSDLTLQQEEMLDTLKTEILGIKEEYQNDLVSALNGRIDDLTTLLAADSVASTAAVTTESAQLTEHLKDDLAWNIVTLKAELEKIKNDATEIDKDEKLDNLNAYLNALTNSLEAQVSTTTEQPAVTQTTATTPASSPTLATNNKLTDGFFVFEDSSNPLYTYRAPNMRNK